MRYATTNAAVIITWNPTFDASDCGPVLYYTVTATSLADVSDRSTVVWGPRAELSNLLNGTNYNISVAAVNRAGSGPSSTVIVVTGNGMYNTVAIYKISFEVFKRSSSGFRLMALGF